MTSGLLFDRLRAWDQGAPVARGSSLLWPRAEAPQRLVIAFVRMGGESLPWGVAIGHPDEPAPRCFSVPEPRNPDQHAKFVQLFANEVLQHVINPTACSSADWERHLAKREELFKDVRLRQLWVPGPTHLDMLHFLDFRYTLARTGDEGTLKKVRPLGRAMGWLFRESTRPGQVRVHDATARLCQSYTFPAEPTRQAHLGYLLGWLSEGSRDERLAAARAAEALSASTSLDPTFEHEELADLVARWNALRARPEEAETVAAQIHEKLVPELERRWRHTVRAIELLDADERPSNPQLDTVLTLGQDEFYYQYWLHEARALDETLTPEERRVLGSHPESDFAPPKAANRYFMHLHSLELSESELKHGDSALLEQALDMGNGFRGIIREVWRESKGRSAPTFWRIETSADDSLRLREESKVCQVGAKKRIGQIQSIKTQGNTRSIVIEITDGTTKRALPNEPLPDDAAALVGRELTFVDDSGTGISLRKSMRVWRTDGPGSWLTHATPSPEPSPPVTIRSDLIAFVKSL